MANINEIAKNTLLLLKERGLKPTPENYAEVFEELASKHGISAGTKEKIAKFKALLIPTHQEEMQFQKMKNIDEFLSFLISKLNRQGVEKSPEFFRLLHHIMKILLNSKDKKVKEMASITLGQLSKNMDSENVFLLEKKWQQWQQDYKESNESIDNKLAEYGIKNEDFALSISKLLKELKGRSYKRFVRLLCLCLQPSLTKNETLEHFEERLKDKPYLLAFHKDNDDFYNELTQMVSKRVGADMMYWQQTLNFFEENLHQLSTLLDDTAHINKSNLAFALKHSKNGKVMISLDELKAKFGTLTDKLAKINKQVGAMNDSKQREEWSLQSRVLRLDEEFLYTQHNYALCVFSISNYRFIIEKYGLNNLNEILLRFRKILKDSCTQEDELWMLDEKSYLLIVYEKDYNQIIRFMQRNMSQIENFKFIYKEEVIKPKIISFFMDKQSYPHLNILEELVKKLEK